MATLLNLKLHHDGYTRASVIKCFGYASPPCYMQAPEMTASVDKVNKALANSVCFIAAHDCVPFLSVDSLRRMFNVLALVDEKTKSYSFMDRALLVRGKKKIPADLLAIAQQGAADLQIVRGGERLSIAACCVYWYQQDDKLVWDHACCEPAKISCLPILLASDMVLNHLPPEYETGIAHG